MLSPGRDAGTQSWLSQVPARDGTWVVEGWAATRFEPGIEVCRDLDVVRRTGHLLHAHLAGNVLLDLGGAPLVIDVSPAWRPPRWAEVAAYQRVAEPLV